MHGTAVGCVGAAIVWCVAVPLVAAAAGATLLSHTSVDEL